MDVVSTGPLRVSSILWQPKPATWVLTVVCKATFVLGPGESRLADDQDDPTPADAHWDDDEGKSLRRAGDLAPFKPRADIILVGHAYAPRKQQAMSVTTRLLVGEVDKSIDVHADRAFSQDGSLRQGAPFSKMPLRYERAAGGAGTSNPVGVAPWPDRQGMIQIPNLQPAGLHLTGPQKPIPTINYGPIAPTWPSRLEKVSFLGPAWSHRAWFQQPIPEGLDRGYFNVAPRDQQTDTIRANERIILENLHPDHARLITSLPGLSPRAVAEHGGGVREEIELYCDTLAIDTDQGRCSLTWRGQLRMDSPHQPGRVVVSAGGAPRADLRAVEHTADLSTHVTQTGALPFTPSAPLPISPPPIAPPPIAPPPLQPAWPAAPAAPPPPPMLRPNYAVPVDQPDLRPRAPLDAPPAQALSIGQMAKASPAPEAKPGDKLPPGSDAALRGAFAAPEAKRPDDIDAEDDEDGPNTARPQASVAREIVSLLWLDPKAPPRLRKKPVFRAILDALEEESPDEDLDDEGREDHRDVLAILTRGAAADAAGIDAAVAAATRPDGSFVEPLILSKGELELPFDELETLKATAAAVTPLVADDKHLRATLDLVNELLRTPWLHGASGGAAQLTSRLKEAFAQGRRVLPAGYLDAQTERALLEQRHYQRRTVFGKPWLRALFRPAGDTTSTPIPTYLPESLAKELPMFQRFGARLLAEVHFQQDQFETHPLSLRVVALARAIPRRA